MNAAPEHGKRGVRNLLLLREVDARAKLIALLTLSAAVYLADAAGVALAVLAGASLYLVSEPRLRGLADEMKFVFVVIAAGVVARVATEPTVAGAFEGGLAGARFLFIVAIAYAVASTSSSAEFEASVESALRHVPFVRESDWAVMFGAAARFLPTVSEEVRMVRRAHTSRLGDRRRFDRRLRSLAFPVLVGSLRRADTLALAMASRAYSPDRTRMQQLTWRRRDSMVVLSALGLAAALTYL